MRRTLATLAAVAGVIAVTAAGISVATAAAADQVLVLTDDGMLSRHDASRPLLPKARVMVTGLAPGERLIGLDTRPANATVYALSSVGQLYTVDHESGRATPVGAKIALAGQAIGFDVNPVADLIRVVTDTGQNLRLNPDTGAVAGADTDLAYATVDVAAGRAPEVAAAGYTNSVPGASGTALYGVDSATNSLVTQGSLPGATPAVSPNAGKLFTVGGLGVDIRESHGFDIKGTASVGAFDPADYRALAAVRPQGSGCALLVEIDLGTGRARPLAPLPGQPVGLTFLP